MVRRLGLGRVRRLAVADLWTQQQLRAGAFILKQIAGAQNFSDHMTKAVNGELLTQQMDACGFETREGRSSIAPRRMRAGGP